MVQTLKRFWEAFWTAFHSVYNKSYKEPIDEYTQKFRDTEKINFLSIFVQKLNNLVNAEATFEVETDSVLAEPMVNLSKNLESNRYRIAESMLGDGECWVFPSTDSEGNIYHRYLPLCDVRILKTDGDKVTDVLGVVDKYTDDKNNVYFLNRRHTLVGNVLTVETYVTTDENVRTKFEPWEKYESAYCFVGAENIGAGRFKSPVSDRGKSPVYGVPLNFGCKEIEERIFRDLEEIEKEFKNARSILFADPLILRKGSEYNTYIGLEGEESEVWKIPENLFPIDTRGGQNGGNIDIFSPEIRYNSFRDKLFDDMQIYEQQVGTDRGFLTPFESGKATTATEIRRANASTIALIDKVHTAIKKGVEETLRADGVFLNISEDLYTVNIDWFDVFADEAEQYRRLANAVDRGVAEKADELRWLFPNMTPRERERKLARICRE